jgi:antitoxin VapB
MGLPPGGVANAVFWQYILTCTHHQEQQTMAHVLSRVFMNGNSQAVRIPQEFRLETNQVEVSRNERGELIIRPIPSNRGEAILQALSAFDDDFVTHLQEGRDEELPPQEREEL